MSDKKMQLNEVIEACARAAHEANRAYCIALGDHSQVPWEQAPGWQVESARHGALGVINGNGPRESHESWLAQKRGDGWVYGALKDPDRKTHPCMVPYDELPVDQKAKDTIFVRTVRTIAGALRYWNAGGEA